MAKFIKLTYHPENTEFYINVDKICTFHREPSFTYLDIDDNSDTYVKVKEHPDHIMRVISGHYDES